MKVIGFIAVAAVVLGFGLVYGGYVGGDVDVNVTDQGRSVVNSGLDSAGKGVQNGLNRLKMNKPHISADMEIKPLGK